MREKEEQLPAVSVEVAGDEDRPAHRETQRPKTINGLRQAVPVVEEIVGVEFLMALVKIDRTVILTPSGFRHEANGWSRVSPVLGGVVVRNDFRLRDRIHADCRHEKSREVRVRPNLPIHCHRVPEQAGATNVWRETAELPSVRRGPSRVVRWDFAPW